MPLSRLTVKVIRDKISRTQSPVGDLLYQSKEGVKTINGGAVSVSDTEKLGGLTLEQVRDKMDASSIGGESVDTLLASDRTNKFRMLADTDNVLSTGNQFMMGVTFTEELYWWGRSPSSLFVPGNDETTGKPFYIVNPLRGVSKVKCIVLINAGAYIHYENNDLYAWGKGKSGAFGVGATENYFHVPQKILSGVVSFTTCNLSYYHSHNSCIAILENGEIWSTGNNNYGQLGIGNTTNPQVSWVKATVRYVHPNEKPVKVLNAETNYGVTFILSDSGKVYVAGSNSTAQLGVGSGIDKLTEFYNITVLSKEKIVDLIASSGGRHGDSSFKFVNVMALTDTGEVYSWGANTYGSLGLGHKNKQYTPLKVNTTNIGKVKKLVSGKSPRGVMGVITDDDDLYLAGSNADGQLGTDTDSDSADTLQFILSDVEWVHFTSSVRRNYQRSVIAKTKHSTLYGWGARGRGQLGINNSGPTHIPTKIPFDETLKIKQITSCGVDSAVSTYILLCDGRVFGSGNNSNTNITFFNSSDDIYRFIRTI